jgi:hypothetical protein
MFALLADFEGEMSDVDAAGRDVLAREIVDMLVGMLMVPQR